MVHILPCNALQRHKSCDTYPRTSPDLAVWGGGIRTYSPSPLEPADAWRHQYVSGMRVRQSESTVVNRVVARVCDLSARRRLPSELIDLQLSTDAPGESDHGFEREKQRLTDELEREREDRATLELQFASISGRLDRLERLLRARGHDELFWEAHDAEPEGPPDAVDTVSDAVLEAQIHLADAVAIPDSAPQALGGIDTGPNAVSWANTTWRGLRALAEYARATQQGFEGGFWNWCQNSGHPLAWPATTKKLAMRESETVMNNSAFRAARCFKVSTDVVSAGKISMEAHLKVAEGGGDLAPRIYFYDDTSGATGKVHVGLVGPHYLVPNSKT